jgi:predicted nuclease of predicted toxin-antitoxin system
MAKIKFYMDEHVSRAVVRGLRRRNIDVLTAPEAGTLGASDEEHLERGRREGRVIFTQDSDFLRLAAASDHAGIVYTTQESTAGEIIHGLTLIFLVLEMEEMKGRVEYL